MIKIDSKKLQESDIESYKQMVPPFLRISRGLRSIEGHYLRRNVIIIFLPVMAALSD